MPFLVELVAEAASDEEVVSAAVAAERR